VSKPVALVTGAGRGIGRSIAVTLGSAGHPVAINYLSRADDAKQTLEAIESQGGEGLLVQADVSIGSQVDGLFSQVEERLGPVGILVNNAGVRADGLALSMSDANWEKVISTNLYGTFACCRRALRPMLKSRSGRIVNVASVAGLHASPGQVNYAAAKAGVIALTQTLAREIAGKGITVNAVAPGIISTELTTDLPGPRFAELVSQVPMNRAGEPEDVAPLVRFLCSDEAAYITGSVFVVDGGMTS
jgi:3-oxoacyl-[acyl-carrier protein] reductase